MKINPLSFAEALDQHATVADAIKDKSSDIVRAVSDVWGEITNTGGASLALSRPALAARYGVPIDIMPVLREPNGIAAAFFVAAYSAVIEQMGVLVDHDAAIKSASDAFAQMAATAEDIRHGFGYDRSAAWDFAQRIDSLPEDMKKEVADIARLAGVMFRQMKLHGPIVESDGTEFVRGTCTGDDLARIVDDELTELSDEEIAGEALARLADGHANLFRLTGEKPMGAGPFVLCLDESGSMYAHRRIWSKAIGATLIRVAHSEGRDVSVVHFSMSTKVSVVRRGNAEDMITFLASWLNGGTDIGVALLVSLRAALAKTSVTQRSDVVLVTDGGGSYSSDVFDKFDAANIKLFSVAVDTPFDKTDLARRAERYVYVSDADIAAGRANFVAEQLKDAAIDWSRRIEA